MKIKYVLIFLITLILLTFIVGCVLKDSPINIDRNKVGEIKK